MKYFLLSVLLLSMYSIGNSQDKNKVVPAFEDLVGLSNLRDFTLSDSGDEGYFTIQSPQEEISAIAKIVKTKKGWSKPVLVSFSGKYKDLEPFLSPDKLRLYFVSNRPLKESDDTKDFDIWYVERKSPDAAWGSPVNVGSPVNTEYNEFYPAITNSKNLYFTCDAPIAKGKDDIFVCEWTKEGYSEAKSLPEAINSEGYEFNAYIAANESFIIFTGYQRTDGLGSGDLYISFRNETGDWEAAFSLGAAINSKQMDYCPFYDMKSKTLYFTSRRSSIQKTYNFKNIEELIKQVNGYENGFSRLYKVQTDLLELKN